MGTFENDGTLILMITFLLGLFVGIIIDRLIVTNWVDEISKKRMMLFLQLLTSFVVLFVFLLLNIHTLFGGPAIDKELYWVFAIMLGSVHGMKLGELNTNKFYDIIKNGTNNNKNN